MNNRNIDFGGDYNPLGNSYLAVYRGKHMGTVYSDGSNYDDIYSNYRSNAPSVEGTSSFQQCLSVRQNKRSQGTVTTANHFIAWANTGMLSRQRL
ncbi:concanavalin A-like lectin/glucanase domain-containing protein [Xylaria longipes]|nr:concanavalin A-like lectin/glucanase domain-containing protein [Xylaria longipes]